MLSAQPRQERNEHRLSLFRGGIHEILYRLVTSGHYVSTSELPCQAIVNRSTCDGTTGIYRIPKFSWLPTASPKLGCSVSVHQFPVPRGHMQFLSVASSISSWSSALVYCDVATQAPNTAQEASQEASSTSLLASCASAFAKSRKVEKP